MREKATLRKRERERQRGENKTHFPDTNLRYELEQSNAQAPEQLHREDVILLGC